MLGIVRALSGDRPDLVIGAISGYAFTDIQYWVNSLDRSGYTGQKVVICYDAAFDVVEELNRRGYSAVTFAEKPASRPLLLPAQRVPSRGYIDRPVLPVVALPAPAP